ncbi:hypothetical protein Taro_001160 [Colocasia esculenta]|uniref:Uncharacterized protein n=1 Tax=Colocasia esculenta TaxID=4460 RepID=A0A843TH27_COLES|nr:hypothetical protein [Colocasia esculenta]
MLKQHVNINLSRGVDTVHLCVDTSSLSQKPVLNGSQPMVSTQSTCVSTLDDCPRKQLEQLKPMVSTQFAWVSAHFD